MLLPLLNVLLFVATGVAFLGPFWWGLIVDDGAQSAIVGAGLNYDWVIITSDLTGDEQELLDDIELALPVDEDAGLWLMMRVCGNAAVLLALVNLVLYCTSRCYRVMFVSLVGVFAFSTAALVLNAFTEEYEDLTERCDALNDLLADSCKTTLISFEFDAGTELYAYFYGGAAAALAALLAPIAAILTSKTSKAYPDY